MKTTISTNIVYSTVLLITTLTIWIMIYRAQFLDYDDNVANLLSAFSLSFSTTVILIIVWFKWRHIIQSNKWKTITFLVVSSPFTIAFAILNYQTIFGATLKV